MIDINIVYANKAIIKTQKKIGLILRDMILNKAYFKNSKINQISKDYGICKKTIKKYLKNFYYKTKSKKEKRLYIPDKTTFLFLKDLEKIVKKYNGIIEEKTINTGKHYLNNLLK